MPDKKHASAQAMKLGVSKSLLACHRDPPLIMIEGGPRRSNVDFVVIVYQTTSNFGNKGNPNASG